MSGTLSEIQSDLEAHREKASAMLANLTEFDQENLDEAVYGALSSLASDTVNAGGDYEASHDLADQAASNTNNLGPEAQIACLMALGWSEDDIQLAIPGPSSFAP